MRARRLQEELKKCIGLSFTCVRGFPNDPVSVSEVVALPLSCGNQLPSLRLPAEAGAPLNHRCYDPPGSAAWLPPGSSSQTKIFPGTSCWHGKPWQSVGSWFLCAGEMNLFPKD